MFVGSLTSKTHNEWVDGAIAQQKEKYPKMELVGDRNEIMTTSRKPTQRPGIAPQISEPQGIQGSASTDVAGIGLAIEERSLQEKICVVGTSLPSIAGQYLRAAPSRRSTSGIPRTPAT